MNTIIVVYTNTKIEDKAQLRRMKQYTFVSSDELVEGDMIKTQAYDTKLQVIKIVKRAYKYYNKSTGKLTNTFNSSNLYEIVELIIRDDDKDVVYGSIIRD